MRHYRRAGHPRWAKKVRILCPMAPTAAPVVGEWKARRFELQEETVAYFDEAMSTLQRRGA